MNKQARRSLVGMLVVILKFQKIPNEERLPKQNRASRDAQNRATIGD